MRHFSRRVKTENEKSRRRMSQKPHKLRHEVESCECSEKHGPATQQKNEPSEDGSHGCVQELRVLTLWLLYVPPTVTL
jgi:hypothetical protein